MLKKGQIMKLTNEADIERRSRLIYSIYRPGYEHKRSDIAKAAGYSSEYISRLISGERRLSDEAAHNLAPVLGVREEYLQLKDNYMTMDDYTTALSETNDIGILISQIALKHKYITTETISLLLSEEKLSEPIRSFLIQNRYVYGKPHHIVNLNNNKYISINDERFKALCDDISDYIDFKISKLFSQNKQYDIPQ